MKRTTNEHLEWLKSQLNRTDDSFRHSEIYKILKPILTEKGYWKEKVKNSKGNVANLKPFTKDNFMNT